MNDLCVEVGYNSLIKYGEELCGDMVQLVRDETQTVLVLADGLGSGVKANILSTLTSKIISTMISQKMSIEECVSTIVSTLPVCKVRDVAYSTFTIIIIDKNKDATIIQYDNPDVILLRNGKSFDYPKKTRIISDKMIFESKVQLKENDLFISMSDGAIYAGVGAVMNYGWQRENIIEFAEGNYSAEMSAQGMTATILDACNELYDKKPGDDTTIAAIKVRKRADINVLFGPPEKIGDTKKMISEFFEKSGKHIVSGGTTSSLVAEFLNKEICASLDYSDPDIPPTAKIEGVDLVTEGVLTMSRVLEYVQDAIGEARLYQKWHKQNDGASKITRLLFEKATNINFFVGKAVNPAHQNPELPISFNIKMQIIKELTNALGMAGKNVTIRYY